MLVVEKRSNIGCLLPVSIIITVIVLITIIALNTKGATILDKELWSEDIQITDRVDDTYPYLMLPDVQETQEGAFQVLYTEQTGSPGPGGTRQLSSMYVDKLGQTTIQAANTTNLYNWEFLYTTHPTEKSVRYFEGTDTIRFIARDHRFHMYMWFVLYDEKLEVLDENRIRATDIFDDADNFVFSWVADIYWDAEGNAHIAGVLEKDNGDGTHLFRVYYAYVTWEPFSISVTYVRLLPPIDASIVIPRINSNEKGVVGITHLDYLDGRFYRAISIKNNSGTWTTTILDDMTGVVYCGYMAANGLYIESSGVIHIAWADPSYQLKYLRIDELGRFGTPVTICALPVSKKGGRLDVQFQANRTGSLFLAFNVVPYNSKYLFMSDIPPAIVIIPLRDDGIEMRYEDHVLVDSPTATEFVFHIDDEDNFYLLWFDSRTGMTQVFLKYLAAPGLAYEFDLVEWADAQTIRPNETKQVDLLLKNVGTLGFDVSMYIETNASPGWSVGLDVYRARLDAHQTSPNALTIHCPPGASDGEVVEIWINASTQYPDHSTTLRLLVFVKWERGLDVHCSRTYHAVDPGGTVTYHLSVQNTGELLEEVQISMEPTGPRGWTYAPESSMTRLSPGNATTVDITVTSPPDSWKDDTFSLLVGFEWADGKTAHPGLSLRTVVLPTFFVTMDINRTDAVVRPGGEISFNVTVGNAGNTGGRAFISVSVVTDSSDWLVLLSSETVVLGSGEEKVVQLIVTAPQNATGGEIFIVRLRAYCNVPFSEVEREVRMVVTQVHALEWTPGQLTWDLPPLGTDSDSLEFLNRGNAFETVRFRMDGAGPGWEWWIEEDGVRTEAVRVGPGEGATVLVWLSLPARAEAGTYQLQLSLDIGAGITLGQVTLKVNLEHITELSARALTTDVLAYPGGYFEGTFEVTNHGNAPEFVHLSIAPEDLTSPVFVVGGMNSTVVWVPVDGSRTVTLRARMSEETPAGRGHALAWIRSRVAPSNATSIEMSYLVIQPMLTIDAVEIEPPHPLSNEIVTIHLILYNSGPIELVDVRASLFRGEDESIASIAPYGETTAVFTWVPREAGEFELAGLVTYGPGNNSMDWSYRLTVEDAEREGSNFYWLIPVVMAGVIIVTVKVIIDHRDRPSDGLDS